MQVDLEVDSSDSDNNIFVIGICTTHRIKLSFGLCLDSSCFAVAT